MMRKIPFSYIASFVFLSLTLSYTNCGQMGARGPASVILSLKAEKDVGVIKKSQVLVSFTRCLGLQDSELSAATIAAYRNNISAFSQTGTAGSVTAPMLMASITVAGEVCRDLIDVEGKRTNRIFFPGFNLANGVQGTYVFSQTVHSFATACWGRPGTQTEVDTLAQALRDSNLYSQKTRSEALFLCTNILASADGLRR